MKTMRIISLLAFFFAMTYGAQAIHKPFHTFSLHQAKTIAKRYERNYWKGYPVVIVVGNCRWSRIELAKCKTTTTGIFTNLKMMQSISGSDAVGYRHHELAAWTVY